MSDEIDRQSIIDEEHLKLLSLGYMISAGAASLRIEALAQVIFCRGALEMNFPGHPLSRAWTTRLASLGCAPLVI